jgi:hypothetical protein
VITSITWDSLHKVLDELCYCLDITHVTHGAHIEFAKCVQSYKSCSIDLYRREVLSMLNLFLYHFESVAFFSSDHVFQNFDQCRPFLSSSSSIDTMLHWYSESTQHSQIIFLIFY